MTIKAKLTASHANEDLTTYTLTFEGLSAKKLFALQEALADKQHKSVHTEKVFTALNDAQNEFLMSTTKPII